MVGYAAPNKSPNESAFAFEVQSHSCEYASSNDSSNPVVK